MRAQIVMPVLGYTVALALCATACSINEHRSIEAMNQSSPATQSEVRACRLRQGQGALHEVVGCNHSRSLASTTESRQPKSSSTNRPKLPGKTCLERLRPSPLPEAPDFVYPLRSEHSISARSRATSALISQRDHGFLRLRLRQPCSRWLSGNLLVRQQIGSGPGPERTYYYPVLRVAGSGLSPTESAARERRRDDRDRLRRERFRSQA